MDLILEKFEISGLFGLFDYDRIEFTSEKQLLILFGPNGTGKTTILRLINYLKTGDFNKIAKIKFNKARFSFIKKDENGESYPYVLAIKNNLDDTLHFEIYSKNKNEPSYEFEFNLKIWLPFKSLLEKNIRRSKKSKDPHYSDTFVTIEEDRLSRFFYMDYSRSKDFRDEKLHNRKDFEKLLKKHRDFDKKINKLRDGFKCHLIPAQRLDIRMANLKKSDMNKITTVIQHKSNILLSKIAEIFGEYVKISQTQDKDLIERIIDSIETKENYTFDEIFTELDLIKKFQEEYANAGLDTSEVERKINLRASLEKSKEWKDISQAQTLYRILENVILSDRKAKLEVFTILYKKISLFMSIINKHLKNKTLEIHHKNGFVIKNLGSEEQININLLSSGEMNLIILFFGLIFETENDTLILLDEPEISLHVEWQIQFIDNLLSFKSSEVSELINTRFILATHSPQIIHNHRDLTVELSMEEH